MCRRLQATGLAWWRVRDGLVTVRSYTAAVKGAAEPASPSRDNAGRIELIATVVMAVAAILTAWAAFQSAKWSGIQAIEFSQGNASRVESTRADARAGQLTSIDVDVFLDWLAAIDTEIQAGEQVPGAGYQPVEGSLSAVYYQRMRDELRPALDAWLASRPLVNPEAPKTPFELEQYVLADAREAQRLQREASEHTDAALTANQNSDNHVLTAVALALVIFFAGVSSKVMSVRNRRVTLAVSMVVLVGAGVTLAMLPKVAPF